MTNATLVQLITAQFVQMIYVKPALTDTSLNIIKIIGLKLLENVIHAKFLTALLAAKDLTLALNVKKVGNFLVKEKMINVSKVLLKVHKMSGMILVHMPTLSVKAKNNSEIDNSIIMIIE